MPYDPHRPSNMPNVWAAVPSTAASPGGLVLLRKLPDEPWLFVNVLLDGAIPRGPEAELRVQQALVGGYIEGLGRPTVAHPYRLVCNESGRALRMAPCTTACGPSGSGTVLLGPVLLVRCRCQDDEWTTDGMSLADGAAHHVQALNRSLGGTSAVDEGSLDGRLHDLHLTSVTTKGRA